MKKRLWIPRKMFYQIMWPSLVSAVVLAVADIADALVIGARIGEMGLAAIGIVTPVFMIYNLLGYGFSTGGCVTHSRLVASGWTEKALIHFRLLTLMLMGISLGVALLGNLLLRPLLALLGANESRPDLLALCEPYARPLISACPLFMINFILYDFVRCDDHQALASLGFSLGCIVDVVLNVLFVLILRLGVSGSIWATITAQAVSVGVLCLHFRGKRGVLRLKEIIRVRAERKACRREVRTSLYAGFSSSVRYVFQLLFLFLGNRLLLRAGDLKLIHGEMYVAVFDVVMNVSYVAMSVYQAAAETMQPLASTFDGEHDRISLAYVKRLALSWGLGLGIGLSALLALLAPQVSAFFGVSDIVSERVSAYAIRVFCCSTPLAGFLVILSGYFQSVGRRNLTLLITLLRGAVFLIPFTFLMGWFFPKQFWWLFACTEGASVLTVGVISLIRGKERKEDIPVFSAAMDNDSHEMGVVLEELQAFCEREGLPMKKAMQLQLATEELCLVTMEKAFSGKEDEYIQITISAEKNGDYVLRIRNSAPVFNPFDMETGKLQQSMRKELLDSMGVLMVKKMSREMNYRNYEGFNVLRVVL